MIHHYFLAFFPALIFGPSAVQHFRFEDNIFGTPFTLAFAGTFAVASFFVLSGFVLTIGFFQTKNIYIIKKLAAKRYLRLMIPALATTLICYLLIKLGAPNLLKEVTEITQSQWLSWQLNFDANIFDAIYSGTIGVFIEGSSRYNNVLWTMLTEFLGSFLVFAFVLLFGASRHRWIAYVMAIFLTFNSWFLPFIIGMAIADLYTAGYFDKLKRTAWWTYSLVPVALILGAFPLFDAQATGYGFIDKLLEGTGINGQMLLLTIGAAMLILAVITNSNLSKLLEMPRISILGKYTFALYLVHIPVMYSVVFLAFISLYPLLGYNLAVLATFVVSIPVLWIVTILFEKYIDAPAVRLASSAARMFEKDESLEIKKHVGNILSILSKLQIIFLRPQAVIEKPSSE